MASEELTLREVFLADSYEEQVERLNKRIAELEAENAKLTEELWKASDQAMAFRKSLEDALRNK